MEASMHQSGSLQNPAYGVFPGQWADAIDLEKQIVSAGLELKRIISCRLLGEMSDQQYQLQAPVLCEQYRRLTQAWHEAGYTKHVFSD